MTTPLYPITPSATRHNGQAYAQVSDGMLATSENMIQTGFTDPVSSLPWMTVQGAFEWCAYLDSNLVDAVVPLAGGVTLAGNNTYSGTSTFSGPVVLDGAVTFGAAGVLNPRCTTITPTTETITAQTKDLWELAEPASDVVLTLATPAEPCTVAFLMAAPFVTYSVAIKDASTNVLATFAPTVGPTTYLAWAVLTFDGTAWKAAEFSTDAPTYATLAAYSGTDGSQLVGVKAITSTQGGAYNIAAGTLRSVLQAMTNSYASSFLLASQVIGDGAALVGVQAITSIPGNIPAGTVEAALQTLADARPVGAALLVTESASPIIVGGWLAANQGSFLDGGNSTDQLMQPLSAGHGEIVTEVRIWVVGAETTRPAAPLSFEILVVNLSTGATTTTLGPFTDAAANGGAAGQYGGVHAISSGAISITVDRTQYRYLVVVSGESGSGSTSGALYHGADRVTAQPAVYPS